MGVSVRQLPLGFKAVSRRPSWRFLVQPGPREQRRRKRLADLLDEPGLRSRFDTVRQISAQVRSSEYHLTNACNIRCDGCWFFAKDFDRRTSEPPSLERWRLFAKEQASEGVTAAFIGNILDRMQSQLGAELNRDGFRYRAEWNAVEAQIEMSLISTRPQSIRLAGQSFHFAADEPLHVSTSRKFTLDRLADLATSSGWTLEDVAMDDAERFAVAVLKAARGT